MSTLPEEISKCTQLETVDISNNSFVNLPNCLFNLPKIIKIIARKNFIAGVLTIVVNHNLLLTGLDPKLDFRVGKVSRKMGVRQVEQAFS